MFRGRIFGSCLARARTITLTNPGLFFTQYVVHPLHKTNIAQSTFYELPNPRAYESVIESPDEKGVFISSLFANAIRNERNDGNEYKNYDESHQKKKKKRRYSRNGFVFGGKYVGGVSALLVLGFFITKKRKNKKSQLEEPQVVMCGWGDIIKNIPESFVDHWIGRAILNAVLNAPGTVYYSVPRIPNEFFSGIFSGIRKNMYNPIKVVKTVKFEKDETVIKLMYCQQKRSNLQGGSVFSFWKGHYGLIAVTNKGKHVLYHEIPPAVGNANCIEIVEVKNCTNRSWELMDASLFQKLGVGDNKDARSLNIVMSGEKQGQTAMLASDLVRIAESKCNETISSCYQFANKVWDDYCKIGVTIADDETLELAIEEGNTYDGIGKREISYSSYLWERFTNMSFESLFYWAKFLAIMGMFSIVSFFLLQSLFHSE